MDTLVRSSLPAYFQPDDLSVRHLEVCCAEKTASEDYPLASAIQSNVPVFEAASLSALLETDEADDTGISGSNEHRIKSEFALCLRDGPGVFVIKRAYDDTTVLDKSTALFKAIVADEQAAGSGQGDHFGKNERIWNVLQKVCERSPADFLDYYGNRFLALACEAWLGPAYQMTAQMNTVKPGSEAQAAHRDYHLGFQSSPVITQYPAHAQVMSQYLTLQGAVAHVDMPVEMGPTLFLPHSQKVPAGYLSFNGTEAREVFASHQVQLPLDKGDLVFFNPALMHGAGTNKTSQDRVANLLQISSAFGRPMESVDRLAMVEAAYAELQHRYLAGVDARTLHHAIAALADGYAFPTNLDADPPVGGNAPETAQQIIKKALARQATQAELVGELQQLAARQRASLAS